MKNNSVIIISGVALFVGLTLGYVVWENTSSSDMMNMNSNTPKPAGHMMPDGTMMMNMEEEDTVMTMDNMMDDMMKNLEGKTGTAFDEVFLREMIIHHEGAVVMAEAALTSTERPEILALANAIIAAQNQEISQMKAWESSWFQSTE